LLRRYADDLGNDLGNLLHRVLAMIGKYRQGKLPAACPPEAVLLEAARGATEGWEEALETLQFSDGLKAIWAFLAVANRYVDQQAPWSLAKRGDEAALDRVLYASAEALRIAAVLIAPVMPSTADEIERQLGLSEWPRTWEQATQWGLLPGGQRIGKAEPLFPRLEESRSRPDSAKATSGKVNVSEEQAPSKPEERKMVSFKDFQNLELRVAEILTAEPVPGANKLLKLTVDIGAEQRTLVAGIALAYQPEDLIGKKIVVICNLEPATIRGVRSEGMLLAGSVTGDDTSIALVTPEKTLPNGAVVK
jgi:methionyl-tRNA synthetase